MAVQKDLSIIVKAVDQATAPLRQMATGVVNIGNVTVNQTSRVSAATKGVLDRLFSLRNIVLGFVTGATIGRIVSGFNATTKSLESIGDASERLGLTVETLSALKYTADLNGSSFEELANIVSTAQKNVAQFTTTGGGKAAEFLRRLNVELEDTNGNVRKAEELIPDLARAISQLPTEADKILFSEKIFGSDKILNLGIEKLKLYRQEAQRLGAIFTPEQVRAAQDYRDSIDRIAAAWEGVKARVIQSIGPALAEILNKGASFVAAIPEMISTLAGNIKAALTDEGPVGAAAREGFSRLGMAIGLLVSQMAVDVMRVLYETVKVGSSAVVMALFGGLKGVIGERLEDLTVWVLMKVSDNLKTVGMGLAGAGQGVLGAAIMGIGGKIDWRTMFRDLKMSRAEAAGADFGEFFRDVTRDAQGLIAAFKTLRENAAAGGSELLGTIDNLIGVSEALAKTTIDVKLFQEQLRETFANKTAIPTFAQELTRGWTAGIDEFIEAAENGFNQGRQLAQGFANTIATNLTGAIMGLITHTKTLAQAVKEFFAGVFTQIAQMIVQLLVVRALAGIFGAMVFGGASGTVSGGETITPGVGFERTTGYAHTGGLIASSGIQRYHGGGMPGAGERLIMAQTGEGIINRRAMAGIGSGGLAQLNRGGGMGDTINITVNVTMSAGGGGMSREDVKRAAAEGVLAALSQRPAFRAALRQGLA
ncbi:MAG: hypothetical protein ABL966_12710 [Acidimicrobiales bacterium]